jgi:CubicO group peptidase (beta-lactamase class C family)
MKKITVISLLWVALFVSCQMKSTTQKSSAKIDSLFHYLEQPNSPGAAIAVIKNGKVIFEKGYGNANLEYDIPITPSSIFHIASESKQYTAFCIVLLAKEGKLGLDDDIRKYLPYVPDFGKTITIRQLINHTSGLRDQWQLLAIGGESIDDVIKQEHIIKLIENQKDLNFEPGSRFLYCNTGYTLLAEIVKKVSGKSLREFADERIFKPLGMLNTHFHDDNTEIVKGRTYSYDSIGANKYANNPLNYSTVGATSLFTTVEDEVKWLNNYETGQVGGKDAIQQMFQQAVLNNGTKLGYAFALSIDSIKGYQRIGHGGADAGYRTYTVRFPEENLGIAVFTNCSKFNASDMAMKVADVYLPKRDIKEKPSQKIKVDSTLYRLLKGSYYSLEGHQIELKDSSGLYIKFDSAPELLVPLADTIYRFKNHRAKIIFPKNWLNGVTNFNLKTKWLDAVFYRFEKPTLTETQLEKYCGTYVSDELDVKYQILSEKGKLVLRHRKYPDINLKPITANQFLTPLEWMTNILFNRNEKGEITGFEVNCDRVLHLKFNKTTNTNL